MNSRIFGTTVKYAGEWLRNTITLEQSITRNDKYVKIKTNVPKRFYEGQHLTLYVDGIELHCIYESETQIRILSADDFTIIHQDKTVYVLFNFKASAAEELVPKSELDKLNRIFQCTRNADVHNQKQQMNLISYIGEIESLDDKTHSFGDVTKYNNKFYVFSKVMLSCVIEKVTQSELTITSLGNAQKYLGSVIIGNASTELKFISQDNDRTATYTYESSVIPSVSDEIYAPMWQEIYLPVKLLKLIVEGIS